MESYFFRTIWSLGLNETLKVISQTFSILIEIRYIWALVFGRHFFMDFEWIWSLYIQTLNEHKNETDWRLFIYIIIHLRNRKHAFSVFPYSYRCLGEREIEVFPRYFEFSQTSTSVSITHGNTGVSIGNGNCESWNHLSINSQSNKIKCYTYSKVIRKQKLEFINQQY